MTSLVTPHDASESLDERALFERAQSKLSEAFTLLQTLEQQLHKAEERRNANASVHDTHAAERAELLAYVERVHSEALELANKPVTVSRESRERVRRVTMRIEAAARALQNELPAEPESAPSRDTVHDDEALTEHLSQIAAAVATDLPPSPQLAQIYDDEVTPLAKRQTVLADPFVPSEHRLEPPDRAVTLEMPRAVGVSRRPSVRTVLFDPSQNEHAQDHLNRERAGARLRRDRSPTEIDYELRKPPLHRTRLAWWVAGACIVSAVIWVGLIFAG